MAMYLIAIFYFISMLQGTRRREVLGICECCEVLNLFHSPKPFLIAM